MENYYLLSYDKKKIKSSIHLYNNGYVLTKDDDLITITNIFVTDTKYKLEDTFSVITHFYNYEYEFLIIEDSSKAFLYSKHTHTQTVLGTFNDKILCVANNTKYTLIITEKSMILFSNTYFDPVSEIKIDGTKIKKAEFSTDDIFVLIENTRIQFFNTDLKKLSSLDISSYCATYIEKYNYWSILVEDKLLFIEDNGCIYNEVSFDWINEFKDKNDAGIYLVKENMIILSNGSSIFILKLVDGKWQTKNKSEIIGSFLSYEDGKIISKDRDENIYFYFINSEYSRMENVFLVSDNNELLVYDFSNKKSAINDFKLEFRDIIRRIIIEEKGFKVYLGNLVLQFDKNCKLIDKLEYNESDILSRFISNELISNDLLNIHSINGEKIKIYKDGRIEHRDESFKFKSLTEEYQIQICEEKLYIFFKNNLYEFKDKENYKLIYENIVSFHVSQSSILYTKDDKLWINDQFIITDNNFKILGTTDLEIYGQSRFNSIDTYYNKDYIRNQIRLYFNNEEYDKSIEMMIKHNIKINLENINVNKMKKLSNKYVIFIIDEIIKDHKIVLDTETKYLLKSMKIRNNDFVFEDDWIDGKIFKENNIGIFDNTIKDFISTKISKKRSSTTEFINQLFKYFENNSTIINYILVKCKRTDLAILFSRSSLPGCIKYIKNYVTKEEIKRSAVLCYQSINDFSLVDEICRLLNEDIHILKDLEMNYHKILEMYKLFDELVYYLIKNNLYNELVRVIEKYNLHDSIFVYIIIFKDLNLVDLYTKCLSVDKKIFMYKYLEDYDNLCDVYLSTDMYNNFFDMKINNLGNINYVDKEKNLINGLLSRKKYKELGIVYEEYFQDDLLSLKYFIQSGSIPDIYRSYKKLKNNEKIDLLNVIVNQFENIEKINKKLNKYIRRLHNIQNNFMDDNFSVTSVCLTNRGIPGNLYEYEFYLEKVNELLNKILVWDRESRMVLDMTDNKELYELMKDVRKNIKSIPELYNVGYEQSKKKIECIDISEILN
jgi:hypothetical protein